MYSRTSLPALCLTILGLTGSAHAGAIFRTTVENFAEDNQFFKARESYVTVVKVEGDRMRMDTQSMEGKLASSVIFLGATDEMYMIDHDKKQYIVMDKEQIDALGQQMSDAMKQMQEALAQVPPEQRAMMERMMKGKMGGGDYKPPSPPVVSELGESGTVNGIACQWKQVTRDDVLEQKACIADQGDIAGGDEMVAIANEMKDFAEGLRRMADSAAKMPMIGGGTAGSFSAAMTADLGGFPLISENYDGEGKLMQRSTFQSADEVAVPDAEFTPPSGYKKQSMQGMMGR